MKKNFKNIINKRFYIILSLIVILFLITMTSLYNLIIKKGDFYLEELLNKNSVTYVGEKAIRGQIFDRNKNLLVGNKEVPIIIYKKKDLNYKEEISIAYNLAKNISLDYSFLSEKDLKNYYYLKNKNYFDRILNKDLTLKYEKQIISEEEYMNYIFSLINEERLNTLEEIDKKTAYIYSLMNEGYSFSKKVLKNSLVTEEEINYIKEANISGVSISVRYERYYPYGETFKTYLGYLGSIPLEEKDLYLNSGYALNDEVGISYLEKQYESYLKGQDEIYTVNAKGEKKIIKKKENGNDLVLSIDINLQKQIEDIVFDEIIKTKNEANTRLYDRSFVLIADNNTGEILSAVAVGALYINGSYQKIDRTSDLTNFALAPGSIVKAASHLVGFENNIIYPGYGVVDSCIKVSGAEKKCSWRSLGYVDDLRALALSSNYYQYLIAFRLAGGSYNYNAPLILNNEAFNIYRNMYNSFGLGVKTGIDLPSEGVGYKGNDTEALSLLDFPIGQYDTYTPMSLLQYIMTLSNNGIRIAPHFLKSVYKAESKFNEEIYSYEKIIMGKVNAKQENIDRVKEGLKMVMQSGTGYGYINLKYNPYGKTGTSEMFLDTNNDNVIDTKTLSNTFGAFANYNGKNISIVVVSPNISDTSSSYTTLVNKRITQKVTDFYFEN